jgi:TfdA family taurine catabolism dioxygenase TauD
LAVWDGNTQLLKNDWVLHLNDGQIQELEEAADSVRSSGLKPDDVTRSDVSLPTLAPTLENVKQELKQGRGFVLVRGLPVAGYTSDELGTIFCAIGAYLGIIVSQSAQGDRLGHVVDRGETDRYYSAGGPIEFHMDPVDVVGLLCLRAALEGGQSRIASSLAVHNVMLEERPDLLETLYRGFHCSRRVHGERATEYRIPVFAPGQNAMESYFLPITIRQAEEEGYPLSDRDREAIEHVQSVAARPGIYLDMDFRPGDIQFLNNRVIFHARTDYRDNPDPDLRRHLLRLWLMMPDWQARPEVLRLHNKTDRAGGGVRSA